jgi:hypothetical protein
MQILEGSCDLGSIESRILFTNTLVGSGLQSSEELTTTAIFHAEIQVFFRLE